MPSELDSTSGDPGRALPVRPWWLVAAFAALAVAWWVFRPERANPLPRGESRGDVHAAPPSNASFEYYEGMLEGDAVDPALAPGAPAATKLPAVPPARGRVEPSKVKSSDNASPDSNVPRDVAVLPSSLRDPCGGRSFARFAGTRRPLPPCTSAGACPRHTECAMRAARLAP